MSSPNEISLKLSRQEIDELAKRADISKLKVMKTLAGAVVVMSVVYADELREKLADELVRDGLDAQYRPTAMGRTLESLIDKMHV